MDNTNKMEISEIHKYAREALGELDSIFKKNGIKYVLLAGSTLGAIRHKGFIPWDDDIDVGVFVEDKQAAYELLQNNLRPPFQWQDYNVNKQWPRLYGKVLYKGHGCIDVFLIVRTSDNSLLRRVQWINRKILFKLYKAKLGYANDNEIEQSRTKLILASFLSKFISHKVVMCLIEKNEMLYVTSNSNYYVNLYSAYSLHKELINEEWLLQLSDVEFEGGFFPTVSHTDEYLTRLYGDYMVLPKDKDRISSHSEKYEVHGNDAQ